MSKLDSNYRIFKTFLILISIFSIWLMIALLSFNPSDPSWLQATWHKPIHNLGGIPGAWLADTLFFIFGVMAYIIPIIIVFECWFIWHHYQNDNYINYFMISLRLIGALVLILASCGLAEINSDDVWYFTSGGVIGSLLSIILQSAMHSSNYTLFLLFIWAIGLTLFTDLTWINIAERIGSIIFKILTFIKNHTCRNNIWIIKDKNENDKVSSIKNHKSYYTRVLRDIQASRKHTNKEKEMAWNKDRISVGLNDVLIFDHCAILNEYDKYYLMPDCLSAKEPVVSAATPVSDFTIQHSMDEWKTISGMHVSKTSITSNTENCMLTQSLQWQEQPCRFDPESNQKTWLKYEQFTFLESIISANQYIKLQPELEMKKSKLSLASLRCFENLGKCCEYKWKQFTTWYRPFLELIDTLIPTQPASIPDTPALDEEIPTATLTEIRTKQSALTKNESIATENVPVFNTEFIGISCTQEKKKIRPQLLSLNRVRIPTSHEIVSFFNIKTPSLQYQQKKKLISSQYNKKNEIYQSKLAYQFTIQQNKYYNLEQSKVVNSFSLANFESSSTKDLADKASSKLPFMPSMLLKAETYCYSTELVHPQNLSTQHLCVRLQDDLIHSLQTRNDNNRLIQKLNMQLPSLDLLTSPPPEVEPVDIFALEQMARLVEKRLADFRIKADVVNYLPGPVITRFELNLAPGIKAARISNLSRDLARSLSTVAVRVVEIIPGKPYVGLELPNKKRDTVYLREVLDSTNFRDNPSPLTVALGKDIIGNPVVTDLAKMPHLLMSGTTGSGKSVGINAIILSILYKAQPEDVRFIMIDPKMLELSVYDGIPHLLTEVVTDMKNAANALNWSVNEMERRYKLMSALGVRNITSYNEKINEATLMGRSISNLYEKPGNTINIQHKALEKLPYIVVLVDEFSDLIMSVGKKAEELIARLAQKARAAGIHLVLATQRPSVDVITGLIKANIPTRIAFTVSSKIDSRTILDQGGAESLLGMGDMLYSGPNSTTPIRVHGAFVRDQEIYAVVQDWKAFRSPQYVNGVSFNIENESIGIDDNKEELDPLFEPAVNFVTKKRKVSISSVQRQFHIGYNRAARIIGQMEAQGIVSEQKNNGNREVLTSAL